MKKQAWSPEPWTAEVALQATDMDERDTVVGTRNVVASVAEMAEPGGQDANAARIVACVNACAGIENPEAIGEAFVTLGKIADWAQVAQSLDCPINPKGRDRILKHARAALRKLEESHGEE